MSAVTGIELGPASCVLVTARSTAAGADVSAVHVIEPAEWRGNQGALTSALRSIRKQQHLARRARVVVWGLPAVVSAADPVVRAAVKPIVDAGFRVERILTPAHALAALAATRRRSGAVAWLSVNGHGAALAIVDGAQLLYSRTLKWSYRPVAVSVKDQLLQRYTLVAHLAPELKRGIAVALTTHGGAVRRIVTCGDLPDLRSLTMPLIEELDLEVETLDSADGLRGTSAAAREAIAEYAPALRLACAAAVTGTPRSATRSPAAIAAGLLISLAGLAAYLAIDRPSMLRPAVQFATPEPVREMPPQQPEQPSATAEPPTVAPKPDASSPQLPPRVEKPAAPAAEPSHAAAAEPEPVDSSSPTLALAPHPDLSSTVRRPAPEKRGGQPSVPVPRVTSILIDSGRRLAIIDGTIVGVGDRVGPRIVVRIEADGVVLRDRSGAEITVLLRGQGADEVKSIPFAEQRPPTGAVIVRPMLS